MYLQKYDLKGRTAVVTGGGQGIGFACAQALGEAGAKVVIGEKIPERAASAAAQLRALKIDATGETLDVTDSAAVEALAGKVGDATILVNNAGVAISDVRAEDTTDEHWAFHMKVNIDGVFYCCRSFGKRMLAQGKGSIVNIGSMSGFIVNKPQPQSFYNASKAAVHHLTKSLAAEWGARGVRVNAVAPTYIETPLTKFGMEDKAMADVWLEMTPMARVGQPEEIASVVLFLASDAASLLTGSIVLADGGYTCWSIRTMKLQGKVAVITGGARGIGRAMGERYASEGARVVVADLNEAECKATAAAIGHGAIGVAVDVTKQASIDALVAAAVRECGGIDILVNNAGVFDMGPLLEVTHESYHKIFAVNVEGLFFTLQAVARQMVKQGRGGKIINFASQAGRRGEGLVAVYCASKAAVISITQSAGLALAKENINVNGIAPGVVDTPMWDHVDALFAKHENLPIGEKKRQVGLAVPYGRMGTPQDMTGMALFLASANSDYIVAQTYNVDGGNWMS